MDKQTALKKSLSLINRSKSCILSTNGDDGFPNAKAMLNYQSDGIKTIWFSTNTSSMRVKQLTRNNRACVYYCDDTAMEGLMLVGRVTILQDHQSRQMLWRDGCEMYYPRGVDDPDYTVLKFSTKWANLYLNLSNITFVP